MRDACHAAIAPPMRAARKNPYGGTPIVRPMTSGKACAIEMDVHNLPTVLPTVSPPVWPIVLPRTGDNANAGFSPPVAALLWELTRRCRAPFFSPLNLHRSKHLADPSPPSPLVALECNP